jgi:WD40 repeat protein
LTKCPPAADATQLETWLGQGPLTLTNIFDKAPRLTGVDFHAAADGKGATFSVIEVVGMYGGDLFDKPVLVGGYNPQSWNSFGDWGFTPLDADRTAFVFNLTQGLKFDQRQDAATTNRGVYQTLNSVGYGPTIGGGHDLTVGAVDGTLNSGFRPCRGRRGS